VWRPLLSSRGISSGRRWQQWVQMVGVLGGVAHTCLKQHCSHVQRQGLALSLAVLWCCLHCKVGENLWGGSIYIMLLIIVCCCIWYAVGRSPSEGLNHSASQVELSWLCSGGASSAVTSTSHLTGMLASRTSPYACTCVHPTLD
jgi:hypothetical protein